MGMLRTRKGLAGLVMAALGATVLLSGPTAGAASVGTVTVSYAGMGSYSISPTSLTGALNDTFTLKNTMIDNASSFVSLQNASGSVSLGGTPCTSASACPVYDLPTGPNRGNATGIFTLVGFGDIDVYRYLAPPTNTTTKIGTITLSASGGGSGSNPPIVSLQYTATADANGGACTGTTSWTRIPGFAAFAGVFNLPTAAQCARTGYTLSGWATTADAARAAYAPGAEYSMSDNGVTLYAVWRPLGIQVVYDANVGLETQCIAGGRNLVTAAERQSTAMVVDVGSATATAAPCSPFGLTLAGWALTGGGQASIAAPGAALPASLTSGTAATLFARWCVPATLAVQRRIFIRGERGEVSGKPAIVIRGETQGFAAGDRLLPYFTLYNDPYGVFSGYSAAEVDACGFFTWRYQTGKGANVHFTSTDNQVISNFVDVPAG